MHIIDTHTHLYLPEFDADRDALIKKAMSGGVSRFYLPNIDSTSVDAMLRLEESHPEVCLAMMGLHPCSVNGNVQTELDLVESWLKRRKFVAIGEIGLDLYWDKTFINEQRLAFRTQMNWALEYGYAVSIHCRNAFDELYGELKAFSKLPRSVFHCFSGNAEQAHKILALGDFMLGIGGVLTFKNSGLDKVVMEVPLEKLVLETDAPYLAPVPFRGKRNEPAYILEVAKKLAEIKKMSVSEVSEVTSRNAANIFQNS